MSQPLPPSVNQGNVGSELLTVGGSLTSAGMGIVTAASAALPDTYIGSPRAIGVALGGAVAAIGGLLMAIGAFLHARGR